MSDPNTQILDEIENRLLLIEEDSGYGNTVVKVERARLTPFDGDDIPAINYWSGTDSLISTGGGFEVREFEVFIDARDRTRDHAFVDVANALASDIKIALNRAVGAPTVSDNPSTSLGGLVTQLSVTSVIPGIGEGQAPWCGVLLTLRISYKIHTSDPLTLVN